jgi:hypothetical protein
LVKWWLLWLPALLLLGQVLDCLPFSSLVSYWWLAFSFLVRELLHLALFFSF